MTTPEVSRPDSDIITPAHAQLLADKLHLQLRQMLITDTTALPYEPLDENMEQWTEEDYRVIDKSRTVQVALSESERLIGQIPPLVTRHHEGQLVVHYSSPTVEWLKEELGEPEHLTAEDVTKLYLGLGLVGHHFDTLIGIQSGEKVDAIVQRMGDRTCIEQALKSCANTNVDVELASDLIFLADIRRISEINRLRFGMGVLYLRPEDGDVQSEGSGAAEDMYETRVRDSIISALMTKFRQVRQEANILESTGQNEINALAHAGESVGELHIAALVPMTIMEMQEILSLLRSN